MSEDTTFKPGDFVGYIFAWPGPDITQMVVLSVSEKVKCYDPWFELEVEVPPQQLWYLTERELEGSVGHYKLGSVGIRDKLVETRDRLVQQI